MSRGLLGNPKEELRQDFLQFHLGKWGKQTTLLRGTAPLTL